MRISRHLLLLAVLLSLATAVSAQTTIGPAPENTFSSFMQELITNFVAFKLEFMKTVEGTLGGYFSVIAYIIAWCVAVGSFLQLAYRSEWDFSQIMPYIGRIAICLMLLVFCGDIDGDGRQGDIIRPFSYVGYHLAWGYTDDSPQGNFIAKTVDAERAKFNKNYQLFVESKLMVQVNGKEFPIQYPGLKDIEKIAAVYTSSDPTQQTQAVSQDTWISLLFGFLHLCRSIIDVIDFFLLTLYSFGTVALTLIAPMMMCVFVNRDLAKRFTFPFFWTALTVTCVFPVISQAARYFAFLSANLALGINGSQTYTFDPTTNTIIANGDPTPMILVASICMLISIIILVMALGLSYAFMQGRFVESMTGLISHAFAGLTSVGVGTYFSGVATKLQSEARAREIQGSYDASMATADANKDAQNTIAKAYLDQNQVLADGSLKAAQVSADAQNKSAQVLAQGAYQSGLQGVAAERYQSLSSAFSEFKQNWNSLNAEQKKEQLMNWIEFGKANGDAKMAYLSQSIKDRPEELDLLKDQIDQGLGSVPVIGSGLNTLGINGTAVNNWTRSEFGRNAMGLFLAKGDPMQAAAISNGLANVKTDKGFQGLMEQTGMVSPDPNQMALSPTGDVTKSMGQTFSNPSAYTPKNLGMTNLQRQNLNALQGLMRQDPNFLPSLQQMARRNGWSSNDLLNLMALETANTFRKDIRGGAGNNYVGLIQFGADARQDLAAKFGTPTDAVGFQNHLRNISASQQLRYVESYLKQRERGGMKLDSVAKMYAAVGAGSVSGNDASVIFRKGGFQQGDFGNTRKISGSAYNSNAPWDVNRDGRIQQWEFGKAATDRLGAGIYFDTDKAIGQINMASPAEAKVKALQFSREGTYRNSLALNQDVYAQKSATTAGYYGDKRQIAQDHYYDQTRIAENVAQMKAGALGTTYNSQMSSASILQQGSYSSAKIIHDSSIRGGNIKAAGDIKAADITYAGQRQAAETTRQASLDALYKHNLSSMASTFGSNLTHQLSELFERSSRGQ